MYIASNCSFTGEEKRVQTPLVKHNGILHPSDTEFAHLGFGRAGRNQDASEPPALFYFALLPTERKKGVLHSS